MHTYIHTTHTIHISVCVCVFVCVCACVHSHTTQHITRDIFSCTCRHTSATLETSSLALAHVLPAMLEIVPCTYKRPSRKKMVLPETSFLAHTGILPATVEVSSPAHIHTLPAMQETSSLAHRCFGEALPSIPNGILQWVLKIPGIFKVKV